MTEIIQILATFTSPENIGTTPQSVFWLLPLAVAGCVVYKAMKLPEIRLGIFLREVFALLAFLIGLLFIIVLGLFAVTAIST
jgi:hypothetical protein